MKSSTRIHFATIAAFSLLAILTIIGYSFSKIPGLVVDEKGEINGAINKLRASFRGKVFWVDQLSEVNNEIKSNHKYKETYEKFLNSYYNLEKRQAVNVELLRTPEEVEIEKLKQKIESLERKEIHNIIEADRKESLDRLIETRETIKQKIANF